MKIKVSELEGVKLDMWVARANRLPVIIDRFDVCKIEAGGIWMVYSPSKSWSQGGPIIDRHQISIIREPQYPEYRAGFNPVVKVHSFHDGDGHIDSEADIELDHEQFGEAALIAAMRCFVASKFGEEVEEV